MPYQETDQNFDGDLDGLRKQILGKEKSAAHARDWLLHAISVGTRVHTAYQSGRFPLGDDVGDLLYAFDQHHMTPVGSDVKEVLARRRRIYHLLQDSMLANHEYTAARLIREKLIEAKEGRFLSYRHLILWRLLAGGFAGSIALGGSSTWREMTVAMAGKPWGWVVIVSAALITIPALATELFQAPEPVLRDHREVWARLTTVWKNAIAWLFLLGGFEWGLFALVNPSAASAPSWKGAGCWQYHLMTASVSLAIGYVINLVWRDRSLAGPG